MLKIEQEMINAIQNKRNWRFGNTSVEYLPEIVTPMRARIEMAKVYLYSNCIATYSYHDNTATIVPSTLVEWPTVTTFSRLRALGLDPKSELKRIANNIQDAA